MNKKLYTLIAIIVVIGGFVFYQYQSAITEINKVTTDLVSYINPNKELEEPSFLIDAKATPTLEVVNFLKLEKLTFKDKSTLRLTGLKSAAQNFTFTLQEKEISFEVEFEKGTEGWKLAGFPDLVVYPQTIILKDNAPQNTIDFLYGGETLTLTTPDNTAFEHEGAYFLVTLQGKLIFEKPLEKKKISKLIALDPETLEGELEGQLALKKNIHYYDLTGPSPSFGKQEKPSVGQKDITAYANNGEISLVVQTKEFRPENIRVTLNSGNYKGLEHSEITLSSSTGLTLEDKLAKKTYSFSRGESLTFTRNEEGVKVTSSKGKNLAFSNRVYLTPKGGAGIAVSSLRRGQGTPVYPGHLEIFTRKGNLYLVNELPLEKYLYSVVPSEMPVSFGLEALKVQAIAARSYALSNLKNSQYAPLSAHVDDSVLSQVFNNNKEESLANQAVNATKGLALYYNDQAIDAKFFSTSSGLTANAHEVWQNAESMLFPGKPIPYLKAKSQLPGKPDFSLTTEEQFATFFSSSNNLAFDRESPWFRWEVEMTGQQLGASIEKNLVQRYQAEPDFILTRTKEGWKSKAIAESPIGTLKDLKIVSRGAGGNIMELRIESSNGTYLIRKELNIRYILSPSNQLEGGKAVEIKRRDGSLLENYPLLPSTFFSMYMFSDMEPKALTKVILYGGGNGHGVGMSQWGVKGMLAQRYSLSEILSHYYPGTRLINIYEDEI